MKKDKKTHIYVGLNGPPCDWATVPVFQCAKCHGPVEPEFNYCPWCGRKFVMRRGIK